jgi:hypothetical protein
MRTKPVIKIVNQIKASEKKRSSKKGSQPNLTSLIRVLQQVVTKQQPTQTNYEKKLYELLDLKSIRPKKNKRIIVHIQKIIHR